jgi:ribosomal protein S18 acetylase RimI-like enzyme
MTLILRMLQKENDFEFITSFFRHTIENLYGDQTASLKKIENLHDRHCELLILDNEIIGILVYKLKLTDEFKNYYLTQSFEIKTLALINPEKTGGRGYGSLLLQRAAQIAINKEAKSLLVTVSTGKPEVLSFFINAGFKVINVFVNQYKVGLNEYLLAHHNLFSLIDRLTLPQKKIAKRPTEIPHYAFKDA